MRHVRRTPDRAFACLRQTGIIDDQKGVLATNQPVGLGQQGRFQRRAVPDPVGDEMMQLVMADRPVPSRYRLHALAITRANEPGNIGRTHPPPRLVPKRRYKRRQPGFQIAPPVPHKPPASLKAGSL